MATDATARNRARVQEIYAAYLQGNLPFVLDAPTDDACWASGDEAVATPWCGTHRGREGVQGYFAALAAECGIVGYHVDQVITDGDWVAVTARARARCHHNGAEREISKVDVMRLRDGRISEFHEYHDTSQIAADLRR